MTDAIVSIVAERLTAIIVEQISNEINLVRGVENEVINLSNELKKVQNLLDDADRRAFKDKSIKSWLKRLEHASYEMDDLLDEWNFSLLKLRMEQHDAPPKQKVCCYSSCLCFKKVVTRRDIAKRVKNVLARLDLILSEKDKYSFTLSQGTDSLGKLGRVTTSFVEMDHIKGRDCERDILVSKLILKSSTQGDHLHITSIVGSGGIGKTTLAQLVYNDSQVKDCFPLRIWICVSDPFDEANIAKEIVEQVQKTTPSTNQLQMLLERVTESISGNKFLLVLDDVWNGEDTKWGALKHSLKIGGASGSRILVTTRNERVAKRIGTIETDIHRLGQLSDEDCWLVLRRMAFFERNDQEINKVFLDISLEIAKKCKGLPLAAKTLGSLLRFKNTAEEWEDVLKSEIWQLENAKVDIFPHLSLSYNDLSPAQKHCFSYCAVFPKDYEIDVNKLIGSWMALGYLSSVGGSASDLELRGREYFDNLAMRSLFQNFERDHVNKQIIVKCKMHDIIHDFAQFLEEDVRVEAMISKKSSCQQCQYPLLFSRIKEFRSLFLDTPKRSIDLHICDYLSSLRVLSLSRCALESVPKDIEKLIHLRYLNMSENYKLCEEDLKILCKLSNLQTLLLASWNLIEIPREIGNLVRLRHLDLSRNKDLKKLSESICDLHELRILNISGCTNLSVLPKGIHSLINLKHLLNNFTYSLTKFPHGISQLTGLRTLNIFNGGRRDWSKLGWLKYLNRLSECLQLTIDVVEDDIVEQAREAELRKKMHLQTLEITFWDNTNTEIEVTMRRRMDVIHALEPHPNLQYLKIEGLMGSKFPEWIVSPFYQLKGINLSGVYCSSLPPLGKLPLLESLEIYGMYELQFVGREFLGITSSSMPSCAAASSSSASIIVGFPKLKSLGFYECDNWKEWEDITIEDEESDIVSVMPCLIELEINDCASLTGLPRRMLHKAPSINTLRLSGSHNLVHSVAGLKSHIPHITF